MKIILDQIRKNKRLHETVRQIYGNTIGFWKFKDLWLKNIGLFNGKKRIRLMPDSGANNILSKTIISGKPFMFSRYGSTEFRTLFKDNNLNNLCFYSGFFPNNSKLLKRFRKVYFEDSKSIDMLAIWNYQNHFIKKIKLIRKYPNIRFFSTTGVSDITYLTQNGVKKGNTWPSALEGKRVLVIHPFKESIEAQYKKRKQLGILPKLKSFEVIRAVQTLAGGKDLRFNTWFDALDYMKKEIDKKEFDVAIIGCGAYGLPLAAYVKSIGKQGLHLGGASQLLFGIKGKRWEDMGYEFNHDWISPLKEDTFEQAKKIEGGCYW